MRTNTVILEFIFKTYLKYFKTITPKINGTIKAVAIEK